MFTSKEKRRLIRQIRRSSNCIVITRNKDLFEYDMVGKSLMFNQFFQKLVKYVPDWFYKWAKQNEVK